MKKFNLHKYIRTHLQEALGGDQKIINQLLDKINTSGVESLTHIERNFLDRAHGEEKGKSNVKVVSDWLEDTLGPLYVRRIVYYKLMSFEFPEGADGSSERGENVFQLKLMGEKEGGDYVLQLTPMLFDAMTNHLQDVSNQDKVEGIKQYVLNNYGYKVFKVTKQ